MQVASRFICSPSLEKLNSYGNALLELLVLRFTNCRRVSPPGGREAACKFSEKEKLAWR
jgi:hypothetical protein